MGGLRAIVAAGAVLLALAGCEVLSSPIGPPPPDQVALKPGDLPSGLKTCPGSGSIDGYLKAIRTKDPDSYATVSDAWATFRKAGANAAAITAYADDVMNCSGLLGAGRGKSASSFVIRYNDEGSAATAYERGILQFPTPNAEQQTPGLIVGDASGLGTNSWVFDQSVNGRAAYIAFWQRGSYDVMVLIADLDPETSKRAVDAVDSRAR